MFRRYHGLSHKDASYHEEKEPGGILKKYKNIKACIVNEKESVTAAAKNILEEQ